MTACIVGWAHSKFGKLDGETSESLITKVASEAIAHAGIEPKDVDVIYVGNMNGGFVRQEFHSSLALQTHPDLRFKPSTRVENACATGSAAIHMGLNTLSANKARFVLVVGVEKMTELNSTQAGEVLIKASYVAEEADIEAGFAGIFGKITSAYFQRYGDKSDALAKIAVKAHKNGLRNPFAHFQQGLRLRFLPHAIGQEPVRRGPPEAHGLLAGDRRRRGGDPGRCRHGAGMKQAIAFRAAEHVNDFLPMSKRDIIQFEGAGAGLEARAGHAEPRPAGPLGFVETHDCFTSAELIEYEAMGLTAKGEGERAIHEGWVERDGKLPVNVSGGLKAKGHPVGATGVSMHVMAAMQLSGTAGDMQLEKRPTVGGVFNMGGAAVANYVSVLETLK